MATQPLISHFSPGTTGGLELVLWMCWPPQDFYPLPRMTFGEIIVESQEKFQNLEFSSLTRFAANILRLATNECRGEKLRCVLYFNIIMRQVG